VDAGEFLASPIRYKYKGHMAKTLRTSGDYTIKAGAGTAGTHEVIIDAKTFRVKGDLTVDGDQTVVNTSMLSVEDTFIELARNVSDSSTNLDAGIYVNRGALNGAVLFWDESEDKFKAATTTDSAGTSPLTVATLAAFSIGEPSASSDATTKGYVDTAISTAGYITSFDIAADSGAVQTVVDADTITIAGGGNISTVTSASDTVTINLDNDLINITSITSDASNGNLTLKTNGTGNVVVNNILTFNSNATAPTATSITKLYSNTVGGGATGVFFVNNAVDSGAEGELISKKKARALAIALGG